MNKLLYRRICYSSAAIFCLLVLHQATKATVDDSKAVSNRGFWEGSGAVDWHIHDPSLAENLIQFFQANEVESILDLGAGTGAYTRDFMESGLRVTCYDGNPNTQEITEGRCGSLDLSKPIALTKSDWVMSLEVGEHIPPAFETTFIHNLHRSNKRGIILSWAVPGQEGTSHVNNQPNEYIADRFIKLGYTQDTSTQTILRAASRLPWFKNTIMVFRKLNDF